MVDIGTLSRIINAARAIQEAAEKVEQNQEDCEDMKGHVALVTTQLERLKNNGPLMMDTTVSPAVAAFDKILPEAQELVKECQVKRNIIHLLCTAGTLSKKLRRMNKRIMDRTMILMCAMIGRLECQRPTQEQVGHEQPPAAPDGDMSNQQPISIVNEIVGVADRIKETAKMVRRNKDKCLEIDERAGIVSAFLTQLENTDVIKDPALSAKLKKIVNTFQHAYELVTGCQEWKNLFMIWPGQLSKELHKVLDQMVLDLDGITEISIRYTKGYRNECKVAPLKVCQCISYWTMQIMA
ncbi:hypothetical protein PVAP13_3NG212600 [Panicum virgatum]|uniref:Mixed lineage kinase domain-containing protein n=1 Tax=Panicum virgatum TaxID=38727 RepID=A0A8T0UFJ2_PANVG|nr:hypothetical protein PVAP13_3NG212600 [Panicum virgatum]KAG2620736.1 hypothetical protein PVAP13_3NG212600 [Panicum virgatum]KAG2620744.1 hypothetical protein PVAP13_3NG212600 [Panicum virgatum]